MRVSAVVRKSKQALNPAAEQKKGVVVVEWREPETNGEEDEGLVQRRASLRSLGRLKESET